MGSIIGSIVYGSALGVMNARKIAMPRIAHRRHERRASVETTPISDRKMSTIGNSNESPNASETSITKDRNRSPVSAGTNSEPAKPRRKLSAFGSGAEARKAARH